MVIGRSLQQYTNLDRRSDLENRITTHLSCKSLVATGTHQEVEVVEDLSSRIEGHQSGAE